MKKILFYGLFIFIVGKTYTQAVMSPELLWSLGRVGAETISPDGKNIIFGVTYYDVEAGTSERNLFKVATEGGNPIQITTEKGGENSVMALPGGKMGYMFKGQIWQSEWDGTGAVQLTNYEGGLNNVRFSPNGMFILFSKEIKMDKVMAAEVYPDLTGSNVRIINELNYRHWDTWEDGAYQHVFYAKWNNGIITEEIDIMAGQKYDCPQMPFGGIEDMVWHPDSKRIVYVTKQKTGAAYATSTNTDIYVYNIENGKVQNVTDGMMGYDTNRVSIKSWGVSAIKG